MTHRQDIIAWIDARLPRNYWVSIPELCAAGDVDDEVVRGWIDSGEIEAMDHGAGSKQHQRMVRHSVLDFYARRAAGIRAPAPRTIPGQPELFKQGDRT